MVAVLCAVIAWGLIAHRRKTDEARRTDTVVTVRTDTVRDTMLIPVSVRFDHWDTIWVFVEADSGRQEEIPVQIPIEKKEYTTADYHAIVTGYRPELKLMEIFRKTETVTIKEKKKKWGLGLQTGVGYPSGWYIGVGISYDILQW